ncbi:MAG: cation transporter [Anaerolineae bacterium]
METKTFKAPAIHCGHCTNAIEMEVGELSGVKSVTADLDSKMVTVSWDVPANWEAIQSLMEEMGYPPAK